MNLEIAINYNVFEIKQKREEILVEVPLLEYNAIFTNLFFVLSIVSFNTNYLEIHFELPRKFYETKIPDFFEWAFLNTS